MKISCLLFLSLVVFGQYVPVPFTSASSPPTCAGSFSGTPCTATVGSGQTYATVTACLAAIPSDLTTGATAGSYVCALHGTVTESAAVSIGSHTTDSAHGITITADTGQSFMDNANVRTNALTYNEANGAAWKVTAVGIGELVLLNGTTQYLTISRLQLSIPTTATYFVYDATQVAWSGLNFLDIIAQSTSNAGSAMMSVSPTLARNVLLINNSTTAKNGWRNLGPGSGTYIAVGVVHPSDLAGTTGQAFVRDYGTPIIKDCYSFGLSTAWATGYSASSGYNATDLAAAAGSNNQTSLTYTSQFTGTTSSALNFIALGTGSLAGHGVLDSTNAPNDITGSARPSSPTIGPWQILP